MATKGFCYLYLTCENKEEASKIAQALLKRRLIVCAKQIPITADYYWKDNIEHSDEILLVMESRLDLFEEIEKEVTTIHSYDTFVLEATPISKVSKTAVGWMDDNLK